MSKSMPFLQFLGLATTLSIAFHGPADAQVAKAPSTSRTVFKCTVDNKVVYSDEPCLGAQVLNVQPTRGMNKSTGKELTGKDVMMERTREAIAQAVRPATGMNDHQFDVAKRRMNMSGPQKAECVRLEDDIAAGEAQEPTASKDSLAALQNSLLVMRTRYRGLGC
jgi:hypothetical protein